MLHGTVCELVPNITRSCLVIALEKQVIDDDDDDGDDGSKPMSRRAASSSQRTHKEETCHMSASGWGGP